VSGNLQELFGSDFPPDSVDPQDDFDVLPPGKYPVMIEKAEVKETKKRNGNYIELQMVVLDGPCKGRKIWDRMNIVNENAKAVEIAMRCLSALGRALGLTAISDTSQLINGCCIASVKVKDGQNEVRTYAPLNGQQGQPAIQRPTQPQQPTTCPPNQYPTQHPAQQPQFAPPQQPTQTNAPPWAR
jgi:hypothetical protein